MTIQTRRIKRAIALTKEGKHVPMAGEEGEREVELSSSVLAHFVTKVPSVPTRKRINVI
jgi:hypothetical protein